MLAEIRTILDDDALSALEEHERAELLSLRPPDDLRPLTVEQLPAGLRDKLTDKNGRVGELIAIRPANHLDEWDGRDLIRFA